MNIAVSREYERDRIVITYYVDEDVLKYEGPAFYSQRVEIYLKQLIRSGLVKDETEKLQQKRLKKGSHPKRKRSAEDLVGLIVKKPTPTVETMKELLPDMMDAVFYSDEARLKIAGKWQTIPVGWPQDVRLVPPGNYINEGGQKRKTRLADLKPMYDFLRDKLLKMQNVDGAEDRDVKKQSECPVTEQRSVDKNVSARHIATSYDYGPIKMRRLENVPNECVWTRAEISDHFSVISPRKTTTSPSGIKSPERVSPVEESKNNKFPPSAAIVVKSEEEKRLCNKINSPTSESDLETIRFLGKRFSEDQNPVSSQNTVHYSKDSFGLSAKHGTLNTASSNSNGLVKKNPQVQNKFAGNGEDCETESSAASVDTKYKSQTLKNISPGTDTISCHSKIEIESLANKDLSNQDEKSCESNKFVPIPVRMLSCSPSHDRHFTAVTDTSGFRELASEKPQAPSSVYLMAVPSTAHKQPGVREKNSNSQNICQTTGMPIPSHRSADENGHSQNTVLMQTWSTDQHPVKTSSQRRQVDNKDSGPKPATLSRPQLSQQLDMTNLNDLKNMSHPCINITVPAKITLLPEQSQMGMLTGSAMINMPLHMAMLHGISPSRPIMTAQPSPDLTKTKPFGSPNLYEKVKSPVITSTITSDSPSFSTTKTSRVVSDTSISAGSMASPNVRQQIRSSEQTEVVGMKHSLTDIRPKHLNVDNVNKSVSSNNIKENATVVKPVLMDSKKVNINTRDKPTEKSKDSESTKSASVSDGVNAVQDINGTLLQTSSPGLKNATPDESAADLLLFFSASQRDQRHPETTTNSVTSPESKQPEAVTSFAAEPHKAVTSPEAEQHKGMTSPETKQLKEEKNWRNIFNRKRRGGVMSSSPPHLQRIDVNTAAPISTVPSIAASHHVPSGLAQAAALSVRPPKSKVDAKRFYMPVSR